MPNNDNTTTSLGIDVSQFKRGLQDAQRQIKLANAEFKTASASMDKWSKSTDGLQAKIKQLESVLDAENKKLEIQKQQLAEVERTQGKNSAAADEMRIAIANQEAAIAKTQKSLGYFNDQLKTVQKEEEKADTATGKLTKTIDDQQKELDELKQKYANVVVEQGKNSKEAQALAKEITTLSGNLSDNKQKLSDAEKAADDLDTSLKDVKDDSSKASDGFTVMKGALADLLASGIKACIQGLKDLGAAAKDAFNEFDEGRDNVIKATGATGEAAKELTKSYKNVAKTVVGDMGDIGSALGEVNTRFGFTGEALEEATTTFVKFADITGTDATNAVKLVARAMGDAGIDSSEYASVLDDLAIAAQASGISVDKLTENLTKYGAPMRALGFDTKEAIAIFSSWEKAGVNTEIAFSGMKAAIGKWSKEGKNAKEEFAKVLEEIGNAPDIATATGMAIEAFGQKAGPDLADAIQGGRFEFSDFLSLLEGSEGTVENTFNETQDASDKVKLAFQNMKLSAADAVDNLMQKYGPDIEKAISNVTPVIESVIGWLGENVPPVIDKIKQAFDKVAPVIKGAFQWIVDNKDVLLAALGGIGAAIIAWNLATVVTNVLAFIKALKAMGLMASFAAAKQWLLNTALLANPIALVVAAIAGLVAAFVILWNKSEKFRKFWINLWNKIKKVTGDVWNAIGKFFYDAWKNIEKIFSGIGKWFTNRWNEIKTAFSAVGTWFSEKFTAAYNGIKNAFSAIGQWFSDRWNDIVTVFSVVGTWFSEKFNEAYTNITAIFSAIGTWFTDRWNDVKNAFSAVGSWFKEKFNEAWTNIITIFSVIGTWFSDRWNDIVNVFSGVGSWFSEKFTAAYTNVKNAFSGIGTWFSNRWGDIKNAFSNVGGWFKEKFEGAWKKIKEVFEPVGEFFGGIWDTIKEKFTDIGEKIGEATSDAFKTAINWVLSKAIGIINGFISAINGVISVINAIPGVDIGKLEKLDVPQLAQGGVLKRGQIGLLEGNGAEAVVPLDQNKKWINATAREMKNALAAQGMLGKGGETVNNYNFTQNNTSPKPLNRLEIYRQTKNQFNMLAGVN